MTQRRKNAVTLAKKGGKQIPSSEDPRTGRKKRPIRETPTPGHRARSDLRCDAVLTTGGTRLQLATETWREIATGREAALKSRIFRERWGGKRCRRKRKIGGEELHKTRCGLNSNLRMKAVRGYGSRRGGGGAFWHPPKKLPSLEGRGGHSALANRCSESQ